MQNKDQTADAASPYRQDVRVQARIEGAILGFAVGDALGVPGEFMSRDELASNPIDDMRGGGAHGQLAGTWSDDTSMTLCMMDSLMEKGIDYEDQMLRFSDWLWNATNTARDEVFDVGGTTKHAIFAFCRGTPPLECGETAEFCCGNGSLMRVLPVALYLIGQYKISKLDDQSAFIIHNTSKCTHAHLRCLMACGIYCAVVFQLYNGGHLSTAVKAGISSAMSYYRRKSEFIDVYPEFEALKDIALWPEEQLRGSGYVIHTLQAALWCLLKTTNYRDCVLAAIRLGEDTDTTAAVAGGLSGLWYGVEAIPNGWLEKLAKSSELRRKSREFFYRCFKNVETVKE